MTTTKCAPEQATAKQLHELVCALATELENAQPVYVALPLAFAAASIDPLHAIRLLADREWRLSTLLERALPAETLALVVGAEEEGDLVPGLRRAAQSLLA